MSKEIGLKNFVVIGNKVTSDDDKRYITDALGNIKVSAFLPYSEGIRNADRDGVSALSGMSDKERSLIEGLVDTIWKGEQP